MLSDSANGYIYRFQVYTGKACESADATVGLCSHSVLHLMQGLEENHHKLITDNYYTSPELFLHLHSKGINVCGMHCLHESTRISEGNCATKSGEKA